MVVAADAIEPVAHLTKAVLLERAAREVAEPVGDVRDLAGHRLVLAQLEDVRAAAGGVRAVGLAAIHLRIRRRLHELVVDTVHQGPILLGLGPLLGALGIGPPGGILLGALLVTLPAPDVDDLVALLGDQGRPEADQAEAVFLPLVHGEAPEAIDECRELAGGDIVAAQFVEHDAPLWKRGNRSAGARIPPPGRERLAPGHWLAYATAGERIAPKTEKEISA